MYPPYTAAQFRLRIPLIDSSSAQQITQESCKYFCGHIQNLLLTVELLQDLGFDLLPELGQENEWVSETIFSSMLISFVVWTFSPFWQESGKRFYTAVLYARVLMVLVSESFSSSAATLRPLRK